MESDRFEGKILCRKKLKYGFSSLLPLKLTKIPLYQEVPGAPISLQDKDITGLTMILLAWHGQEYIGVK